MEDSERYRLHFGPYRPPDIKEGEPLWCHVRGRSVIVDGFTLAPIPWQYFFVGGHKAIIVSSELARAVRMEAAIAVAHWWGVTPDTVTKWRKALSVCLVTPGRQELLVAYIGEKISPEAVRRGVERAKSEESNRKRSETVGWGESEVALLGTDLDRVVAKRLGKPLYSVKYKRRAMGIPAFTRRGE